jgi:hypothetical protein
MEVDYPASHSMDASWFAIDSAGHVAVFTTGENGHLPVTATNTDTSELFERSRRPDAQKYAEQNEPEVASLHVGVYLFSYMEYHELMGEGVVAPYDCYLVPKEPLHVDQLRPELRTQCHEVCFDVRFDQIEMLQPLEFVDCHMWYTNSLAYLSGDGTTVRPVRGHEGEFAAFVRQFRARDPEGTNGLIFDGPKE